MFCWLADAGFIAVLSILCYICFTRHSHHRHSSCVLSSCLVLILSLCLRMIRMIRNNRTYKWRADVVDCGPRPSLCRLRNIDALATH